MRARRILPALLLVAAACSKAPSFQAYGDPAGWSLDAPRGWPADPDPSPEGKLAASTQFIGDAEPQDAGTPLGAVLVVTRLARRPAATKASPAARKAFAERVLAPTRALFKDDSAAPALSEPYAHEYEHQPAPPPFHAEGEAVPMRVEGRVFRAADAFYIVELRGARAKFDRHRPVLERALATFKPGA